MSLSELVDEAQKLLADGSSSSRSLVAAAVAIVGLLAVEYRKLYPEPHSPESARNS